MSRLKYAQLGEEMVFLAILKMHSRKGIGNKLYVLFQYWYTI